MFSNAQNYTYLNSSGKKIPNEENAFTRFEIEPVNESIFSVYKSDKNDKKWGKKKLQYSVLQKSEKLFYIYDNEKLKDEYEVPEITENLTLGYRIKQTNKTTKFNLQEMLSSYFQLLCMENALILIIMECPWLKKRSNSAKKLTEEGVRVISSVNVLWEPAHSNNNKIPVWHYAKITFGGSFIFR